MTCSQLAWRVHGEPKKGLGGNFDTDKMSGEIASAPKGEGKLQKTTLGP